jgi:hypothetical protein
MKKRLFTVTFVFALFFGCEKVEMNIAPETLIFSDKVIVENDYLAFNSIDDYFVILKEIAGYTEDQKIEWAKSLGFVSAHIVYNSVESELLLGIENGMTNFEEIKSKYAGKIRFSKDEFDYNFYARSLEDVLNCNGVVKIGSTIYLFTEDKEYMVLDGDPEKIQRIASSNLKSVLSDSLIVVVDPSKLMGLKKDLTPIAPETGEEGIHPAEPDRYRIKYLAECNVYSTYAGFDPYNMVFQYHLGYSFKLDLVFQKKTIFWFKKNADVSIEDVYLRYYRSGEFITSNPSDIHEETNSKTITYFSNSWWEYSPYSEGFPEPGVYVSDYEALIYTDNIDEEDGLVIDYD